MIGYHSQRLRITADAHFTQSGGCAGELIRVGWGDRSGKTEKNRSPTSPAPRRGLCVRIPAGTKDNLRSTLGSTASSSSPRWTRKTIEGRSQW
jgi:hypothetical protein